MAKGMGPSTSSTLSLRSRAFFLSRESSHLLSPSTVPSTTSPAPSCPVDFAPSSDIPFLLGSEVSTL
ncbi:hypothetical protein KFK09_003887 [Dendrobium nobile]|uniref:Uncharacterized protein n=1 Tax=Dendrobium nobile TaxID=94219 RepID=A0A8T3C1F4_DENNO|nr:hypothetical protein KFK09_003887 [Dendrobium nobile]